MAEGELKACLRCKQSLPIDGFHRDKNRRDGRYPYCKPCHIAEVRSRQANPERRARKRIYDRERVARLKDRLKRQYRANYELKREERIAQAAEWAASNRDKRRVISQNYKHRRRSVERAGITTGELREWRAAQADVCHWCGTTDAASYVVDHVTPLAKGGLHEISNLVIACRSCNARKSARDPVEFAAEVGRTTASPEMLQ